MTNSKNKYLISSVVSVCSVVNKTFADFAV